MSGCSTSPGSTHYAGCDCHEAGWTRRLAAAEARVAKLEAALSHICDTSERNPDLSICEMKRIAFDALIARAAPGGGGR